MRYRLVHSTRYEYDSDVTASYGRAHLLPRDQVGQRVLSADLEISPRPAEMSEHLDFFGNRSSYFAIHAPHTELRVTSRCELDIDRGTPSIEQLDAWTWEQAREHAGSRPADKQYVLASPHVALTAAVRDYASAVFSPGRPLGEALTDLAHRIYDEFDYRAGATTVQSTVNEVLAKRSGVCQDFAHLAVGCLRSVGLAARYVSGYLETDPPPGEVKLQGADASHAWVSTLAPGGTWVDIDPTNNQFVDDRYLVLALGRDYSDVPPLKGVIMTDSARSTMHVSVDVSPVQ